MHERKSSIPAGRRDDLLKGGVILGLTAITLLICWLTPEPQAGGETGVVMELPDQVGKFHGFPRPPSEAELLILPADTTYAKKDYETIGSGPDALIHSEIVLSGREKRSIHRPERCLPAQGWRIESSHVISIQLASGHTLSATALLLNRPTVPNPGQRVPPQSYFVYWFVGKDVTTPYHFERILLTNWDLLFHRINQRWAYIVATADITQDVTPNGRSPEQTLEMLKQFIHDSVPSYVKSEMPPENHR